MRKQSKIWLFLSMFIFRQAFIKNVMTLFTGIIFLNMSFFLAEVSALKLSQDKKMFANIVKLISTSAAEEEKDAFAGTDEDCSSKEVDLIFNYSVHTLFSFAILINNKSLNLDQGIPLLGNYEIYSPPPEG
jgi:hypothetical protein